MKNYSPNYFLLLLVFLAQSCVSFNHFESARTVSNNEFAMNVSSSVIIVDKQDDELNIGALPQLQIGLKYGVSDRQEVGFSLNSGGFIHLSTKMSLLDGNHSRNAFAIGLGADVNPFLVGSDVLEGENSFLLHLPLYYSLHFNEDRRFFFLSPRVVYQPIKGNSIVYGACSTGFGFTSKKASISIGVGVLGFKELNSSSRFKIAYIEPGINVAFNIIE